LYRYATGSPRHNDTIKQFFYKIFPQPFLAGVIEEQPEAADADHYQVVLDHLHDAAVRMMTIPRPSRTHRKKGSDPARFRPCMQLVRCAAAEAGA
jgi:hypothetical protein